MTKLSEIRTGRHCVFKLHVHLVFFTKYRRKIFSATVFDEMKNVFQKVCLDFEASLEEFDGGKDHVHLLVMYPPKVSVSKLVNSLKGVSSRLLRKKFPALEKSYCKGVLWSPSYFAASCAGAPISIIRQYIDQQQTPGE
ncbi:MAG: IS200/IS605 family transposase [Desulfobacteraceae bacterium]|nr:IS200/IS605 family transposase [Desulfobacteraceae bacterium]